MPSRTKPVALTKELARAATAMRERYREAGLEAPENDAEVLAHWRRWDTKRERQHAAEIDLVRKDAQAAERRSRQLDRDLTASRALLREVAQDTGRLARRARALIEREPAPLEDLELIRRHNFEALSEQVGGHTVLASIAGGSPSYYSRLRTGKLTLQARFLRRLEQRLGLEDGWFDVEAQEITRQARRLRATKKEPE